MISPPCKVWQRYHAKSTKRKMLVMFLYSVLVCIKQMKMFLSASSCVFSSCTWISIFSQSFPLQLPQGATQANPFLRHEQMSVLQGCLVVVLHLQ